MSLQTINLGNYANDGTGDDLRTAFEKVNANFITLSAIVTIADGTNLGSGTEVFAGRNMAKLSFKTLTSTDSSVVLTNTDSTVNLQAATKLENDLAPMMGADLGLNGFTIKAINGGGIEAKINGIDITVLNSLVELLLESNNLVVNLGGFLTPTGYATDPVNARPSGYRLDLGSFLDPASKNNLEFGKF